VLGQRRAFVRPSWYVDALLKYFSDYLSFGGITVTSM